MAAQPIREDSLLTGPLEETNEGYAIAKIAGLKLCEYYRKQYGKPFISAMPTNLYGPGDNFHPDHSHVIPGMMRRFHEAKLAGRDTVTVWGSGKEEVTIAALAEAMKTTTGFRGAITFDSSKPDGTPRKALDSTRIRSLGWAPRHTLAEGLRSTYEWAVANGVLT